MTRMNADFIVRRWGEEVTLVHITRTYDDTVDWQEPTETEATSTITGVFQWVSGDEEAIKAGLLQLGDAILFVPTTTSISNEDQIHYQSQRFRVVGVQSQRNVGGIAYTECHLKKLR